MVRKAALIPIIFALTGCGKLPQMEKEYENADAASDYSLQCKIANEIIEQATRDGALDVRSKYETQAATDCAVARLQRTCITCEP